MNYAVILAGGSGSRAGGALPKQFQIVKGRRLIWWSVDAFKSFDPHCKIILAVHPEFLKNWDSLFIEEEKARGIEILKVPGGETRFHSVKNALSCIEEKDASVFIHDGARPLVSPQLIKRGSGSVSKGEGGVPAVPLVDSIRMISPEGSIAVDRSSFMAVQTPQVFISEDIKQAYDAIDDPSGFTDDASVAEKFGIKINLFEGDSRNIKVTNPEDFKLLEWI